MYFLYVICSVTNVNIIISFKILELFCKIIRKYLWNEKWAGSCCVDWINFIDAYFMGIEALLHKLHKVESDWNNKKQINTQFVFF